MDILISWLGVFVPLEFKDKLTASMVWNSGETGDINTWHQIYGIIRILDFFILAFKIWTQKFGFDVQNDVPENRCHSKM